MAIAASQDKEFTDFDSLVSPNNSLLPIWDYVDQLLEKKNMEGYESERNKI
ncbi:hypothetical protein CDBH8_2159 [Corynebacterium diphtheriae BH8]|nr:hypothetical protein CDBH8_2159 [Corynebacterium diphtheriae BH8]